MTTPGKVHLEIDGPTARIVFDNPQARNAMTWEMYDAFVEHLRTLTNQEGVRATVLAGVDERDIAQFAEFSSGDDGVRYNQHIAPILERLESLPCPTIAVLRGAVIGGGLAFAASCDFRIADENARLGLPVARTVGNLPAMPVLARLVALIGPARTKELVFTADLWDADRALRHGLVNEVVTADRLEERLDSLCGTFASHAPKTMAGVKEAVRRIVSATTPAGEDLIREVYGSADFREGVAAFMEKRPPQWMNR
jgi:enoyl-CoA hydratase